MKTFKRIAAMALMFTMIVTSMFTSAVFADITFNDVDNSTTYSEAIYELVNDGIINGYDNDDGTKSFKPEATINRGEFAKIIGIARAGSNALFDATTTQFSDMKDHWAVGYVAYAASTGIVNGYEDGTFRPEQPVTYAEAVKMIVCSLGYGPVVDTTLTPWYEGYIKIANTIGLTKNAAAVADNGAPRGLVAQLVSNMKDCNRLVQTGTDAKGNPTYSTSKSDSILSRDEETEEEGVVIGIYENTLRGNEISLTKSQINISDEIYTLSDSLKSTDLSDYVGKSVKFTYTGSNNKYTVTEISIYGTNETTVVTADQFDSISGNKFYYFENEDSSKAKALTLDNDIYIVYNGMGVPKSEINSAFISEKFNLESGTITFYNNDSDGAMDVAFIDSYTTYYANAPVTNNGITTLNDKFGFAESLSLDEDDVEVYKVTAAGGAPSASTLANIVNKSVVSIAEPLDKSEKTKVMISTATVSGSISSMTSDYDEIEISSKKYKVSPYFLKLLEKDEKTYGFDVGTNVKLYLDYNGRIVCSEVNTTSDPYGYLVDYAQEAGIDGSVTLRIFTTSNKYVDYPLKDTVKINGVPYNQSSVPGVLEASAAIINNGKEASYIRNARAAQIVKYKTAVSGGKTVIAELSTVTADGDGAIVAAPFTATGETKAPYSNCTDKLTYNQSGYSFADSTGKTQFTMNSSTIIFAVPDDRTADTKYKKISYGSFSNTAKYFVEPYDITTGGTTAKVVVYYVTSTGSSGLNTVSAGTNASIVLDVASAKNPNTGDDCKRLTVLPIGSTVNDDTTKKMVYTEDRNSLDGLDVVVGSVIKYTATSSEIDDIKVVFGATDKLLVGAKDNYIAQDYNGTKEYYQVMYGTLYSRDLDDNGAGILGVSPNFAVEGEDGAYTFDEGDWKSFSANTATTYYQLRTSNRVTALDIKSYGDLIPVMDNSNPETASKVLVLVYNKMIKSVYILND